MIRVFVIFSLILSSGGAFCQVCGGGVTTIRFYIENGSKLDSIKYEIIPITQGEAIEIINKCFFDSSRKQKIIKGLENGVFLNDHYFYNVSAPTFKMPNNLMDVFEDRTVLDALNSGSHHYKIDSVKLNGIVKEGRLQFPTLELYRKYIVLKIFLRNTAAYYISNLFGRCGTEVKLYYTSDGFEAFKRDNDY
jgi:hypothetical protein